jgi:hypothetical protein
MGQPEWQALGQEVERGFGTQPPPSRSTRRVWLRFDARLSTCSCSRPAGASLNGFFKWISVKRTTCRRARQFLRAYAGAADGEPMAAAPARIPVHDPYWRNDEGDIYASRHRCRRRAVVIRFYGMV